MKCKLSIAAAGSLTIILLVIHNSQRTEGFVAILSDHSVNVYESTSITLYCLIEPFDYGKCHRWYKELSDGSVQVVAEGSYYYKTETEIEIGALIKPFNLSGHKDELKPSCSGSYATSNSFTNSTDTTSTPKYSTEKESRESSQTLTSTNTTTVLEEITTSESLLVPNTTTTHNTDAVNWSASTVTVKSENGKPVLETRQTLETGTTNGSVRLSKPNSSTVGDIEPGKYYPSRHDSYYMLTIAKLTRADEGKYFCKYYCDECDSRRTELIFTVPATLNSLKLNSDPDTDFVEIGEVVKLTCEVTSRPQAVLQWILVLNGANIPHVENLKPSRVVYDPTDNLFTVTSVFQFRGGNVFQNPMIIYCQVVSPVIESAIIEDVKEDLITDEDEETHHHKRKKRNSETPTFEEHDHSAHSTDEAESYFSVSSLFADDFHYELEASETSKEHGSDEPPIDFEYLTTYIYKRKIYRLPTAAFDRRWRTALIVISTTILILPVLIGFIQLFLRKTEGINPIIHEKGIQDYYKIANSNRNSQNDGKPADTNGEP